MGLGKITSSKIPQKISLKLVIQSVSAGGSHSLLLDYDHSVWAIGSNEYGQLGFIDNKNRLFPEKVKLSVEIHEIAAGINYSLLLDKNGDVWSCGKNNYGELGHADNSNRSEPTRISKNIPKVKNISASGHSMLLDEEGSVWIFGANQFGQLGLADFMPRNQPQRISDLPKVQSVSAGQYHSLFLDSRGFAWSCGSNEFGQLGIGNTSNCSLPKRISEISGITYIKAGYYHSHLIDHDNKLSSCGRNTKGELGFGDVTDRLIPSVLEIPCPSSSINRHTFHIPLNKGSAAIHHRTISLLFRDLSYKSEEEFNESLMMELKSSTSFNLLKESEIIKNEMKEGQLPIGGWKKKVNHFQSNKESNSSKLTKLKAFLEEKEIKFQKLSQLYIKTQKIIEETRSELEILEKEQETSGFFEELIYPFAELEKQAIVHLKSKFKKKEILECDDVSLYLNLCGLSPVVNKIKEKEISGEDLILLSSVSALPTLGLDDILLEKKLEFYCKLLEKKIFLDDLDVNENLILRHLPLKKTILLLQEYGIFLDNSIILSQSISISQLIFMQFADLQKIFCLDLKTSAIIAQKLKDLRSLFECALDTF